MVISIIFLAIFLLLLIYVIPQFANIFKQLKVTIPLPTKILFWLSHSIITYKWWYLGAIALFVSAVVVLYKKKKRVITRWFMSLPLISSLVIKIDLTRFMYNLHLLLVSGISILTALELLESSVLNKKVKHMIVNAYKMVSQGKKFSLGLLTADKDVPPLMVKLIEAGEITGSLDRATKDVSEYLDTEVVNTLHFFTILLEPVILVLVAVVIGGMLIAIIAPIYQILGQIGGK